VEALLDNIRSIHNVGSVFRTCDAAGISALHLGGITASGDHPRMAKAALGAQLMVPWTHCRNGLERTIRLKKKGFRPWAVETSANGQPLFDFQPEVDDNPILLVVGNERAGIDPDILRLCERVLSIPMEGHKRSLNVAVAFGIAAYFVRHILPGAARGA
jgi:tRNA G18 (ribose-2'-O)-methylase SpoU